MKSSKICGRLAALALTLTFLVGLTGSIPVFGQSRRQPPTTPGNQKKNKRPDPAKPGDQEEEPPPPDLIGKPQDAETITVRTQVVNVDAVVYHKKSGKIITGLKKENFAVYEDGVKQEITNFATPEAPITVAMILEYSKLSNYMGGNPYEPGSYEILRPAALFLSRFVRPPDDYVSVIAYDIRPTPLTDFTNDPTRINQVISLLLRNYPAFSEANLFDALKFTLIGGRGDSVVLDNSKEREAEYGGLASVSGRRKAILLVSSGIDTFSKINYGQGAQDCAERGRAHLHHRHGQSLL